MPVIANGSNSKISLQASTLMLSIYPCFEEVQQFYLFIFFFFLSDGTFLCQGYTLQVVN